MAAQDSDHDKARELAEKALDKFVEGDEDADGDGTRGPARPYYHV
jgi:hypothetical protein